MPARQYYYAESLARQTTTSTSNQVAATLTFTPDASTDYYLLASAALDNNSTTADSRFNLFNSTDTVTIAECNIESQEAATPVDKFPVFALGRYTSGGSPSATTFQARYSSESTNTSGIEYTRIAAIKTATGDQWAASDTDSTVSSSTWTTKTTLSFTPATSGDYLIIAYAELASDSTAFYAQARLNYNNGTTIYGESGLHNQDTTNYMPWGTMVRLNLAASSQSFVIEFKNASTGTSTIRKARILALRLDQFDANYYADSLSRSTTTSGSYQDKVTLTQTPAEGFHLVIGALEGDGQSNTVSHYQRVIEGSDVLQESAIENDTDSVDKYPFMVFARRHLTAVSTTWKTQFRSETAGTTVAQADAAISVLQLDSTVITATSATSPGTGSTSGTDIDWSNPGNITASDNSRASAVVNNNGFSPFGLTRQLRATNFGFSIPNGATIYGVKAEIERYFNEDSGSGFGNVQDITVRLIDNNGSLVGNNKAITGVKWPVAGGEAYAEYGGKLDNWGVSLTSSMVNDADFGLALVCQNVQASMNATAYVDHIRLTVYYSGGETTLAPNSLTSATQASASSFIQVHTLATQGAASATQASNTSFSVVQELTGQSAASASQASATTFNQAHSLTTAGATSASQASNSSFAQVHSLDTAGAASASQASATTFAQVHSLTVANLASATQASESGFSVGSITLAVNALASASVASDSSFAQVHSLSPAALASAAVLTATTFSQAHQLATQGSTSGSQASASSFTQAHTLATQGATSPTQAGDASYSQTHTLATQGAASASQASATTYGQGHVFSPAGATSASLTSESSFNVGALLDPAGLASATQAAAASFAQVHTLAPVGLVTATQASQAGFSQAHSLTVAALVSASLASESGVSVTGHTLAVQDAASATQASALTFAQIHHLTAAALVSASTASTVSLIQGFQFNAALSRYVFPVLRGHEVYPVTRGGEFYPVQRGHESYPVRQGHEVAPVHRGGESYPYSGG